MLTAFEDPDYLLEALKAGASGYLLKHMSAQQIARAIRRVLEGESPLDQEVAMSLLMRLIDEKQKKEEAAELAPFERPSEEHSEPLLAEPLSPREVEVLRLLTRGQPNEQIARNLFISVSTVKGSMVRLSQTLKERGLSLAQSAPHGKNKPQSPNTDSSLSLHRLPPLRHNSGREPHRA
jgi:DNA-binding NarL/FixJ family response regulator